jgi:hypothetical protein
VISTFVFFPASADLTPCFTMVCGSANDAQR